VTIVNEFANTNWAPALGLNLTMSVLIGNSLGANNASLAKKYCKNVIFIGVVAFTI
jgi:Na+-driven multidrug efflux pump